MLFRYQAIDARGEKMAGTLDAPSAEAVFAQLRRQGAIPIRATAFQPGSWRELLRFEPAGARLNRGALTWFTRELATMLGAGQDLDRALQFATSSAASPAAAKILQSLRDAVRNGAALHAAMAQDSRSFPTLYVAMVRAGEAGGQLADTLNHLAELLERQDRLASSVSSSLIYPCLLVVAAAGAIWLLLTQVLPQFTPLFAQAGAQLPLPTQILIGAGSFLQHWGPAGLALAIVGALAIRQALRQDANRLKLDRTLLRLPVIGALLREILAARFTRCLGTLAQNGVPLLEALAISRDAVGNLAARDAINSAAAQVKSGARLTPLLATASIFPPRALALLRLGEETGKLGAMALKAAEIHENTARQNLERTVALLTPAIIVVMGGAVAGIIASLLLAMLGLNDLAQ